MTFAAVLVVDDDVDVQLAARLVLNSVFASVDTANNPDEIAALVAATRYDCILLDMNFMPGARGGAEGLSCLDTIRKNDPHVEVILMTAYGGVVLAVEGLKRGAGDFILKPWRNDALVAALSEAAERTRAARSPALLDDIERDGIASALAASRGNVAKAARALGLSRPALYRRMAKHGL